MLNDVRNTVLAFTGLMAALASAPDRADAQSYQIDCAILLCLPGGWPASAPCARARAEFIRRITPWPVEPPLQIWRCPMSAAYPVEPRALTSERIYEILFEVDQTAPLQSFATNTVDGGIDRSEGWLAGAPTPHFSIPPLTEPLEPQPAVMRLSGGTAPPLPNAFALQLVQDRADIDISGPEFNFVRSIRVFQTQAHQWESGAEADCNSYATVRLGSYGIQGDYGWSQSNVAALPASHTGLDGLGDHCPGIWHRSIFVEWRDYEGNYGFEQVNY